MIPEYYPAYVKDAGLGFPCPVIPELAQMPGADIRRLAQPLDSFTKNTTLRME